MVDNDMLHAMSQLIDAKLKPVQNKLEDMDLKMERMQVEIDTLRLDVKSSERAIRKDINKLYDGMDTLIAVLEHKGILPKAE